MSFGPRVAPDMVGRSQRPAAVQPATRMVEGRCRWPWRRTAANAYELVRGLTTFREVAIQIVRSRSMTGHTEPSSVSLGQSG